MQAEGDFVPNLLLQDAAKALQKALDGGRILFVIIEGIIKRPINPKFAQIANTAGFALLIALMLFITYRDILRLF